MTGKAASSEAPARIYAQMLELDLVERHGTLIGGDELRKLLCYPTVEAFRQAVRRGTAPVPIFSLEHRRGHFAIAKDIAVWLTRCRERAFQRPERPIAESQDP